MGVVAVIVCSGDDLCSTDVETHFNGDIQERKFMLPKFIIFNSLLIIFVNIIARRYYR